MSLRGGFLFFPTKQSLVLRDISVQKEIATPPKGKSGGSQRHQFIKCTVENIKLKVGIFPSIFPPQKNKSYFDHFITVKLISLPRPYFQHLVHFFTNGYHQAPAILQLIQQDLRRFRSGGSDNDRIIRRGLRPAQRAVSMVAKNIRVIGQ